VHKAAEDEGWADDGEALEGILLLGKEELGAEDEGWADGAIDGIVLLDFDFGGFFFEASATSRSIIASDTPRIADRKSVLNIVAKKNESKPTNFLIFWMYRNLNYKK
jgi:hypothetical protein